MSLWRRIFEERRRILLPLLIVVVANVAVTLLAVLPLQTSVAGAKTDAVDARAELAEARRLEAQARTASASKGVAEEELRKFYADVLPSSFAMAQKTANLWLTEAARNAGLQFKGSQFSWAQVRDSQLYRASSNVTLQGRYANIRRFLHAVETAQEFLIVERVELAQSEGTGADGVLEVSLVVSTYFLPPPQS